MWALMKACCWDSNPMEVSMNSKLNTHLGPQLYYSSLPLEFPQGIILIWSISICLWIRGNHQGV